MNFKNFFFKHLRERKDLPEVKEPVMRPELIALFNQYPQIKSIALACSKHESLPGTYVLALHGINEEKFPPLFGTTGTHEGKLNFIQKKESFKSFLVENNLCESSFQHFTQRFLDLASPIRGGHKDVTLFLNLLNDGIRNLNRDIS